MKALPVNELKLVAVAYVFESAYDGVMDMELDVVDKALFAAANSDAALAGKRKTFKCDCCGHACKYGCVVVHIPTLTPYVVGRTCAHKVASLSMFGAQIEMLSVAMAERAACNIRQAKFESTHPGSKELLEWAKTEGGRFGADLVAKLRKYGNLSDAQLAALEKSRNARGLREEIANGATAPEGKQTVTGTVVGLKEVVDVYAKGTVYGKAPLKVKMTVEFENGIRVYGSKPEAVTVQKGDTVTFTAVFERSKTDNLFGFFKRPTKCSVQPWTPPLVTEPQHVTDGESVSTMCQQDKVWA